VKSSKKIFVLANPKSGRQKIGKVLRMLSNFLLDNQVDFDIYETTPTSKGTEIIRSNLDSTYTDLLVIGGDGTINEAINGLQHDIPLSIIPGGTGDDFSKTLHIGKNLGAQFFNLLEGRVHRIDLGICNDRKFVNGIGIGFDGQIVADMQFRKTPFLTGHAKYYYHVLQILGSYKARQFSMIVNGQSSSEDLILMTVANGTTFGGGFMLTPHASLNDGMLAVCQVGNLSPFSRFLNISKLQNGAHDKLAKVEFFKTKEIQIEENPLLEAHIDGEYFGNPPFTIKVKPNALKIRAGALLC
jgi:YegS/Rv2252/BmrU family lipid kinase